MLVLARMTPWWKARTRNTGTAVIGLPCALAQIYVVIAISQTSNSLPRTMRRNAAMRGSTSSNWNSKVCGLTVPSLSARLLPCVRVTVFSLRSGMARERPSHRRLRHARARGERVLGGVLERLIRRQHHGGRAYPVVRRIDARRRDALLDQRLGRPHQAVACHDDAVVGGDEVLLGAVADRTHALLQRGVLHCEAGNATEGLASLLRGAVDQIVVVLVGERPIGAGRVLAMHARAV